MTCTYVECPIWKETYINYKRSIKMTCNRGLYVTKDLHHRRAVTDVIFSLSGNEGLMIATVSNHVYICQKIDFSYERDL